MQQSNQYYDNPQIPQQPDPRHRRPCRARRIFRGYLMIAGAIATLSGLVLLIVSLFVELNNLL